MSVVQEIGDARRRSVLCAHAVHDEIESGEHRGNIVMIGTALRRIIAVCGGPVGHFFRSDAAVYISKGGNNHGGSGGTATILTDAVLPSVKVASPVTVMLVIV